ncbi:MAG: XdhC family protein [Thermoplasmata archaeon]
MEKRFEDVVYELAKKGESFVIATVVATSGSSLGKPGFKEIISERGEVLYGTLGGACPDSIIVEKAREVLRTGMGRKITVFLENSKDAMKALQVEKEDEIHVETFCGGSMEVFLDPIRRPQRLVIIGQGGRDEIEDFLVTLGKGLGMTVVLIDPNPMTENKPDLLYDPVSKRIEDFEFSTGDFVILLTKGRKDVEVLEALSRKNVSYIGLLASRKRAEYDFSALRGKVSDSFLKSIHSPVGLDIGAITPQEIAVSIIAEIISVRRFSGMMG